MPRDVTFVISTSGSGQMQPLPMNELVIRHVSRAQWAPAGSNWGHYQDAATEELVTRITAEFDAEKRNDLLAKLNERMNEQAVMIWVAHDVNPAGAVAEAARRFRPLHRHAAGRHAGAVRLRREYGHAGAVRGPTTPAWTAS